MKCDFCGYEFNPDDAQTACTGCPLVKGCHLICCPRCGYQMPPEARLVSWLRQLGGPRTPLRGGRVERQLSSMEEPCHHEPE